MKICYLGNDIFSSCLRSLLDRKDHEVIMIGTYDTDNHYVFNTQITQMAVDNGITYTKDRVTSELLYKLFETQGCNLIIAAGYAYRIPILPDSRFRAINIHPTLLPEGKGPWPWPYVILKQLDETGVTIHKIAENFDQGDILLQGKFKIDQHANLEYLTSRSQILSIQLLGQIMNNFDYYWEHAKPQPSGGSYWNMPKIKERIFNWNMNVHDIYRIVRAFGKYNSFVFIGSDMLSVNDVEVWEETHNHHYGTVVHNTNSEKIVAAKDGYVCLRFFQKEN